MWSYKIKLLSDKIHFAQKKKMYDFQQSLIQMVHLLSSFTSLDFNNLRIKTEPTSPERPKSMSPPLVTVPVERRVVEYPVQLLAQINTEPNEGGNIFNVDDYETGVSDAQPRDQCAPITVQANEKRKRAAQPTERLHCNT